MPPAQTASTLETHQQFSDRIAKLERDLKVESRLVNDLNEDKVRLQLENHQRRICAEVDLEDANGEIRRLKDETTTMFREVQRKEQDLTRSIEALQNVNEQAAAKEARLNEMVLSLKECVANSEKKLAIELHGAAQDLAGRNARITELESELEVLQKKNTQSKKPASAQISLLKQRIDELESERSQLCSKMEKREKSAKALNHGLETKITDLERECETWRWRYNMTLRREMRSIVDRDVIHDLQAVNAEVARPAIMLQEKESCAQECDYADSEERDEEDEDEEDEEDEEDKEDKEDEEDKEEEEEEEGKEAKKNGLTKSI